MYINDCYHVQTDLFFYSKNCLIDLLQFIVQKALFEALKIFKIH
jgi:hypothetical protein